MVKLDFPQQKHKLVLTNFFFILAEFIINAPFQANMKPIFAKVMGELEGEVFLTRIIDRPSFSTEFHFHTECQITYVVESSGYKMVGDCIESFETGVLTFLGF